MRDYNSKDCLNTSSVSFITPCKALNKYMNDPYSVFNENIIPISPMPEVPPMSPVPPTPPLPTIQMPPFPPRPMIGSKARFKVPQTLMISADKYPWNTEVIEGNAIEHNDGSTLIMLEPNTTFEYSFISLTTTGRDEEVQAGESILLSEDGDLRLIDFNLVMGNGLNNIMVERNGRFTTKNSPVLLVVQFNLVPAGIQGLTEANLMIAEIL